MSKVMIYYEENFDIGKIYSLLSTMGKIDVQWPEQNIAWESCQ